MSIQPLPAAVIAQIKSSIAITSLNYVVCELFKNALDAGASRVDISVDYSTGGCIAEDNGSGIPPLEFGESGGLGKLYHSSKLVPSHPLHGGRGTFLASLSATSVLAIVSSHCLHHSHNMITLHRSEVVSRQTPAPPQQHLISSDHGTRVTVRDLFGNMPVRVKQRIIVAEKQRAHSREWDDLKHDIVALLLSWPSNVVVNLLDVKSSQKLTIRLPVKSLSLTNEGVDTSRTCRILSQASYITPIDKASWVSVGASTPKLSIHGAISVDASATKHTQFFSFGIEPLKSLAGQAILHDEMNHMFMNSAFGNDEAEELEGPEMKRQARNQHYDGDIYTIKDLKGRKKSINQWPMFYINIQQLEQKKGLDGPRIENVLDEKNGELRAILELLQAMIIEFLTRYHFRPKPGQAHLMIRAINTPPSNREFDKQPPQKKSASQDIAAPSRSSKAQKGSNNSRLTFDQFGTNVKISSLRKSVSTQENGFETWSRVKSGLARNGSRKQIPDLCDGSQIPRPSTAPPSSTNFTFRATASPTPNETNNLPPLISKNGKITRKPFLDVELPKRQPHGVTHQLSVASVVDESRTKNAIDDDLMTWTNPMTKVVSFVNKRTGLTTPVNKINATASTTKLSLLAVSKHKSTSSNTEPAPWLQATLTSWTNPVFAPAEPSIPQALFTGADTAVKGLLRGRHHHCSQTDIDRAFRDASTSVSGRISKQALRDAEVVSQVDKKFILVKLRTKIGEVNDRMLVLIDQHAADERIRIESLMEELCTPPPTEPLSMSPESSIITSMLEKPLHFEVSLKDAELLRKYKFHFANWGILYQVPAHNLSPGFDTKGKPVLRLSITSLPPSILERCRLDPRLLISLIRTEIYKINEEPPINSPAIISNKATWLEQIHNCPQGLLDMLNSRACRSAIMFNDELTKEQCEILVAKLSKCLFPFQCAHGRPSLVPLVELERLRGMGGLLPREDGPGLWEEMRKWKRSVK